MSGSARPRVGLTTYPREPTGERPRFHLPTAFVDAVREAGGLALLLPPGETRPAELLDAVDALVLTGGGDVHPDFFGARLHAVQSPICTERDAFELALARFAVERGTPLLAICRGLQVLNVALGGDLHVHLPDVVGDAVAHRTPDDRPVRHGVRVAPDSELARLFATTELEVPSWHHQSVARLGTGLRAVAWAADGTVEGLEMIGRPSVRAVQWHPELERQGGSPQRRLFEALVDEAAERVRAGPSPRRAAQGGGLPGR